VPGGIRPRAACPHGQRREPYKPGRTWPTGEPTGHRGQAAPAGWLIRRSCAVSGTPWHPQEATVAGDILGPGQRQAVEDLGSAWGNEYDIGGQGGRYFARLSDGTGEVLEAGTAAGLDAMIRADQAREVTP
jgi:hypothetical protein